MPTKQADPQLTALQSFYFDLARALAAMLVLFGHAATYFLQGSVLEKGMFQTLGVLIFFLLSGFLITHSVLRKRHDPAYGFRLFFIDRFTRIYVAYVPVLLFILALDSVSLSLPAPSERADLMLDFAEFNRNFDVKTWVGNLFMLQNFPVFPVLKKLGVDSHYLIGKFGSAVPYWTISVEWWIYMAFGMIAFRLKTGKTFSRWQQLMLLAVLVEPVYYLMDGYDECMTLLWLLGMLAAILFAHGDAIRAYCRTRWGLTPIILRRIAIWSCALSTLFMLGRIMSNYLDDHIIRLGDFQIGFFLAVALFSVPCLLVGKECVPPLLLKPVRFVADYSFSLYLTHYSIITYFAFSYPDKRHDLKLFWTVILLSNLVAIVFWWLFERHHKTAARWLKRVTAPRACT